MLCTSCVHVCMAAPAMYSCMHVCNTHCVSTHQTLLQALQASCSLPGEYHTASVKPGISLSCIHLCMHEEPEMRPTCVLSYVDVCMYRNQGAKPNICVWHVFTCACMNNEEQKQNYVCVVCAFVHS
jgi:hypothetical protein